MHIRSRIARIFLQHTLPMVTVVLALGLCSSALAHFMVGRSSRDEAQRVLDDAILYYDNVFDEMDSLSLMLGMNNELLSRIRHILSEDQVDLNGYRDAKLVLASLSSPANGRSYISSIYLYIDNPWHLVFSSDGMYDSRYMPNNTWLDWYESHRTGPVKELMPLTLANGTRIIRMCWRFSNAATSQKGLIVLDLRASDLETAYAGRSGALTACLPDGRVLLQTRILDGRLEVFHAASEKYGLTYSYALDVHRLYALSRTLMWLTLVLTLVALLLGLAITLKVNKRERQFLANVLAQFSKVGSTSNDEISEDSNVFDYLNYHVIKTFLEQDYMKWQKEAMEFRALQMQVNPHFLFNALHQIGVASLVEGPEVVMNLVEATGGILRYSLDMGDDMVSLDDEIGIVRKYLYIQRSCHERKIEAEFDIGSAGALPILPMSIQPLVENSMKHGFTEQRECPFRIAIKARVEGHSLVVSIRDNGVGFKDGAPGKGNGIGLDNIRQRLGLFYGRGDLLSISSIPNQYTEIVVIYPQA